VPFPRRAPTRQRPLRARLGTRFLRPAPAAAGGNPTVREYLDNSTDGPSFNLITGSSTAVDDVLVVFHAADAGAASAMTTPTGTAGTWTQVELADLGTGNTHLKLWTRPVTAGGAQTVTIPSNTGDNGAMLYVIAGADPASPIDGSANTTGTASTSHIAASVSPASTAALLLATVASEVLTSSSYSAVSGGMTNLTEEDVSALGVFFTLGTARQNLSASGATGTRTFTYGASKAFAAITVAIKPSGGGTTLAIAGIAASTTSATGAVTAVLAFSGAAATTTSATAALTATLVFAGVAASTTSATGDLTRVTPIVGTAASTTSATGALSIVVVYAIAGDAASTTSATAAVTLRLAFAGAAATTTSATGALTRITPITGSAATTTSATGDVTITSGPVTWSIAGAAATTTSATAAVTATLVFAGVAATTTSATGALTLRGAISADAATTTSATGALGLRMAFAGAAATVTSATGAVGIRFAIAGTAATTTSATGAVGIFKALAGVAATVTAAVGDLSLIAAPAVTVRPFTGTTARPDTGITSRPYTGVTVRP
jgi:hypothetical protein